MPDYESKIRLYGHRLGGGSFVEITEGMQAALAAQGRLAGVVYSDGTEASEPEAGYDAGIGLVLGAGLGGLLAARRIGSHTSHWLMLAPNGERLPAGLAERLVEPSEILPRGLLDGGLLTPSLWGQRVLRTYFAELPIVVCPHGIAETFRLVPEKRERTRDFYRRGYFIVTHHSSAEYERKGTLELMRGWKLALDRKFLPERAFLRITMSFSLMSLLAETAEGLGLTRQNVQVLPGFWLTGEPFAEGYHTSHVLCQPSRAEGYGLTPVEARACGVPTVQTLGTGHAAHPSGRGVVPIEMGGLAPMYDFEGSMAPTVDAEAIAEALGRAYDGWEELARHAEAEADAVRNVSRWETCTAPGIDEMLRRTAIP